MNAFDKAILNAVDCDYFDAEAKETQCTVCDDTNHPHAIAIACSACTEKSVPMLNELFGNVLRTIPSELKKQIEQTITRQDNVNVIYYRGALLIRCAGCQKLLVTVKVR